MGCSTKTYGGRKNCSNTTYIPRIISPRRKYFPALSNADSLLSSHRSFLASLKPEGGGPAGVAARSALEEKVAAIMKEEGGKERGSEVDERKRFIDRWGRIKWLAKGLWVAMPMKLVVAEGRRRVFGF